ncbi:MmcQ/YjbR family DNA-binding protein [Corynebacterium callunae]|uniref:MmcQ/YjbR family DNA-binding protein n=1 Tax=Corynebacterium callunae TaxID=1721 RepID=UPI001FFECB20|nr:MmcQ/YjbR family DNA-binding protein [Corynebacterium callunae]
MDVEFPFGPQVEVFKIRGKMFMFISQNLITVKCDPEMSGELQNAFPTITPGYHMNKKHWISIAEGTPLELTQDLIEDSYHLVIAGLPKNQRPII